MKKLLIITILALLVYLPIQIYSLDKQYFLCPIEYGRDFVMRNDSRGEGYFGADRSGRRLHNGIDLLAPLGTPVLASRSGKVITATQNNGMGMYVLLRHDNGLTTIYGHLSKIFVQKGDSVRQGKLIGAVGKTGNANYRDMQPHLHFEIRKDNVPQDPLEYF